MARIFREYSVELALDETAVKEGKESRSEAWEKARAKAERTLYDGVEFKMSLRLTGKVPLKFVARGSQHTDGQ